MRVKQRNAGGDGRQWSLTYSICGGEKPQLLRNILFRARDNKEAERKILKFLKQAARGIKSQDTKRFIVTIAAPLKPRKGEVHIWASEMIRLEDKWALRPRSILEIKDPDKVLVRG